MPDSLSDTDIEQVVRLIETLDGSAFDYLELQVGDLKVTIGKGEPPAVAAAPTALVTTPAPQVLAAAVTPAPLAAAAPAGAPPARSGGITAPALGVFYAQG